MDVPAELQFERLSREEKYLRAVPGYMKRLRDLYEAIHDRFGEDGLSLIREVSTEYGRRIANNLRKKGELKSVAGVGRYLLKVFDMITDDWEVAEFTGDRLVIRVNRCPYPFTQDEVCRAHTCMEQSLVTTLDANLEYHIGRSIPQGDACCEHILSSRVKTQHHDAAEINDRTERIAASRGTRSVIGDLLEAIPEGTMRDVRVGA